MSVASDRLVRVSAVFFLVGCAFEGAAALVAVPPLARTPWAPFLVAAASVAVLGSAAGKRAWAAAPLGIVAALGLGAGVSAVGHGALAGAGVAFATALVLGEALAAGVWVAGGGERAALGASLAACALSTSVWALLGERVDVVVHPGGVAFGGVAAALQVAAARYADGAVGWRFAPHELLPAAAARLSEVPRRAFLAILGANAREGSA